tara:strand:+ start:244 stop:495 length:252 start_codon:yes stop_codon:yes gene_type:complete
MKTLTIHLPIKTSIAVELNVSDDTDPSDIAWLQELIEREDLVKAELEDIGWDHYKDAWRYSDPQDCWVTDPEGNYWTLDYVQS